MRGVEYSSGLSRAQVELARTLRYRGFGDLGTILIAIRQHIRRGNEVKTLAQAADALQAAN